MFDLDKITKPQIWICSSGSNEDRLISCGLMPKENRPHALRTFQLTDQYCIFYVLRGQGTYMDENGEISLRQGDLIHRIPNHPHRTPPVPGTNWLELYLTMPVSSYHHFCELNVVEPTEPVWRVGIDVELCDRFASIQQMIEADDGQQLGDIVHAMHAFLLRARRLSSAAKPDAPHVKMLKEICRFLRTPEGWRTPIPEVAAKWNLGYESFRKRFTKIIGESPVSYRNRQRIDRGCELLAGTELKIEAIAQQLCYPDIYAFSKTFKRTIGVSPRTYRQQF